jgi:hypothetical protein
MRTLFLIPALLALGGCAMPTGDMMDNKYMERTAEPVPAGVAGDWTGTMGPYLLSMRIGSNGAGVMCSAYHTNNAVMNLKYSGGTLYFQDGTRLPIQPAGDNLVGTSPYFGSAKTTLYKDQGFAQAAPYCRNNL